MTDPYWRKEKHPRYMRKRMTTIDTVPLMEELSANPHLWDRYKFRTESETSPHREVSDIWLRYRDVSEYDSDHPEQFSGQHESHWYAAAHILEQCKQAIFNIAYMFELQQLGGCLITKIPPGKQVYRHSDAGFWHPEYYKDKYLLLLQSSPEQKFCYENESHVGRAGDVYAFNNLVEHWVVNDSPIDRISLIIAGRK